ncbi:MAG: SCO5389 family protein, partial [Pseudonocardiaceae bacterium]
MSLDVPPTMIEAAERGELDDAAFVAVVRDSLPYAWQVISQVVGDLEIDTRSEFADHAVPPP